MPEETKTWEERVIALEAQAKQKDAALAAAQADLAQRDGVITTRRASVEQLAEAEAKRVVDARENYCSSLNREIQAAGGKLLTADQVAEVRTACETDPSIGRLLGAAYVRNAVALAGASTGTEAQKLTTSGVDADEERAYATEVVKQMRSQGVKVALDDDGMGWHYTDEGGSK